MPLAYGLYASAIQSQVTPAVLNTKKANLHYVLFLKLKQVAENLRLSLCGTLLLRQPLAAQLVSAAQPYRVHLLLAMQNTYCGI